MRFKDLAIGQRFKFNNGATFNHECVKVSARKYTWCAGMYETRVGTINVKVTPC